MREIQFRGKHTDNGEWVYGVPVIGITSGVFMVWIESEAKRGRGELSLKDVVRQAEVIPETVGQYTGLKDKNGEEIYEGDVVSNGEFERCSNDVGIVRYDTKSGCLVINNNNGRTKRLTVKVIKNNRVKVLGNFYENPELMV